MNALMPETMPLFARPVAMPCGNKKCPILDIRLIPLTQGKYAIVDIDDYDHLGQRKWFALKTPHTFYAVRNIALFNKKRTVLRMHNEILKALSIDHKNLNGLDNRKSNLRVCTRSQNAINRPKLQNCSSKFKGVKLQGRKYCASIELNNKKTWLGTFDNETDAAIAYDLAAIKCHGQFARLNFPNREIK